MVRRPSSIRRRRLISTFGLAGGGFGGRDGRKTALLPICESAALAQAEPGEGLEFRLVGLLLRRPRLNSTIGLVGGRVGGRDRQKTALLPICESAAPAQAEAAERLEVRLDRLLLRVVALQHAEQRLRKGRHLGVLAVEDRQ